MYTWNPWYGCHMCGVGCSHCKVFDPELRYRYTPDKIKKSKSEFNLPIRRFRDKTKKKESYELEYKIPSGSVVLTCATSDFFIQEADYWRQEAWNIIHKRMDCLFVIKTRRPERIIECLPDNWLDGWPNVFIYVTVENQEAADIRIPYILDLPIKHIGINIEPMMESIDIRPYLSSGLIEQVTVSGETYHGNEPPIIYLDKLWVKDISEQCKYYNTNFEFYKTGTNFKIDSKVINIWKCDEVPLAEFMKLNNFETNINWQSTAKQLEERAIDENANAIYRKLIDLNFYS